MKKNDLIRILADHSAWTRGSGGACADLSDAYLYSENLRNAILSNANLLGAHLGAADLQGAILEGANLEAAYLGGANLKDAVLIKARLVDADLRSANVRGADLRRADLRGAFLPDAPKMLSARWGGVSEPLCVDLMRWDAWCHHDPDAFTRWANGGPCPYSGLPYERAAHFWEHAYLWSPGPPPNPYDLMRRLIVECCAPGSADHLPERKGGAP